MFELIHWLSSHRAMEVLIALGVVLVLVDYFFRTDVPAHFGYLCFSAAFFFALALSPGVSALLMVLSFGALELLHRWVFSRFLTNAPGTQRDEES